jgi:hypothetical protein
MKIKEIAELKQQKTPSIETITKLMGELQDMLLNAKKQNDPQNLNEDGNGEVKNTEEEKKKSSSFDLSKDKASDEDGFNDNIL